MENQAWDSNEEQVYEDGPHRFDTSIRVNNSDREIEPGSSFIETVKATARDAGLGKFRTYLNGREIRPSEAPDTIDEGMKLELRPYDVAGA
jgi:hypothetical protein